MVGPREVITDWSNLQNLFQTNRSFDNTDLSVSFLFDTLHPVDKKHFEVCSFKGNWKG